MVNNLAKTGLFLPQDHPSAHARISVGTRRHLDDFTGDTSSCSGIGSTARRLGIGKAGLMQKQKPLMYKAILARIKEIDLKFRSTEPWLHPTLSKLARERELLVEQANRDFKVGLKHDWR
jgi:hypothetical protein